WTSVLDQLGRGLTDPRRGILLISRAPFRHPLRGRRLPLWWLSYKKRMVPVVAWQCFLQDVLALGVQMIRKKCHALNGEIYLIPGTLRDCRKHTHILAHDPGLQSRPSRSGNSISHSPASIPSIRANPFASSLPVLTEPSGSVIRQDSP